MLEGSKVSPLRCRKQNPTVESKGQEQKDLRPPWGEQDGGSIPIDVGPVQREVEEAHTTQSGPNEVGHRASRRNPAKESQGRGEGKHVFRQELPHGHSQ